MSLDNIRVAPPAGLVAAASDLRQRLEKAFGPDTRAPGTVSDIPSAGHCAAVSAIVGALMKNAAFASTKVEGVSHWFNRFSTPEGEFDVDLTGDQFGFPQVQVAPAGELYPETRVRDPKDLNRETLDRATRLAERAGIPI